LALALVALAVWGLGQLWGWYSAYRAQPPPRYCVDGPSLGLASQAACEAHARYGRSLIGWLAVYLAGLGCGVGLLLLTHRRRTSRRAQAIYCVSTLLALGASLGLWWAWVVASLSRALRMYSLLGGQGDSLIGRVASEAPPLIGCTIATLLCAAAVWALGSGEEID
jgi:hypothetical protein